MKAALGRLAAVSAAAVVLVLGLASSAMAQTTISINPGNVPTTAAEFMQTCDPNLGGGPFPGEDVWVFNLPGDPQTTGVFESVTATFTTPNGEVTRTIPTDGGEIVNDMGTSKAWIRLPAGWTLTAATAVITGEADDFVLTHTCAASGTPSPTPTPTGTPTPTPTGTTTVTPTTTPTLPVTGTVTAGRTAVIVGVGLAAVAGGVTVLVLWRRRETQG